MLEIEIYDNGNIDANFDGHMGDWNIQTVQLFIGSVIELDCGPAMITKFSPATSGSDYDVWLDWVLD